MSAWKLHRVLDGGLDRGWQVWRDGSPISGLFDEQADAESALAEFREETTRPTVTDEGMGERVAKAIQPLLDQTDDAETIAQAALAASGQLREIEVAQRREIQMIGAAISLRDWHGVETAFNELRDRLAALSRPLDEKE